MALATESKQSGNRATDMGRMDTLPPFRDAVNRARRIAQEYDSDGIADEEGDEHDAVRRAREYSHRASQFRKKSVLGRGADAFKLALQHRKSIEEGDLSVFIPAFAFAIAKDGFLDMIPILGQVFGFPIAVYLFVFSWGRGTWKLRLVVGVLSFLDMIPAVGIIPMSTLSVVYIFYHVSKKAGLARKELKSLENEA